MVERIGKWWSLFFFGLYPHDALGVREAFGIGCGKTNKEQQGEQMGRIIPKEPLSVAISNGESTDGQYDCDRSKRPEYGLEPF